MNKIPQKNFLIFAFLVTLGLFTIQKTQTLNQQPSPIQAKAEDDKQYSVTENIENITDHLKSVKIGGGGFVTGIVIHPQAPDIIYARTDVGGLYRWQGANQNWHQLLSMQSVGQKISLAVESVALDRHNPDLVYVAVGAYTHEEPGNILKSVDGGKSWEILDIFLPMGGNGEWRWTGERLAVDPHNSNHIYFGSRWDGLWRSQDGGKSWSQINTSAVPLGKNFGATKNLAGVTFVKFDKSTSGVTYVGVAGLGIYRTTDGGASWQSLGKIANSLVPQQGEINGDGELIVTLSDPQTDRNHGGVWKFADSAWQDVTPKKGQNYAGLAISESKPQILFTVTYPMTPYDIYRSTDGGNSWTSLNNQQQGLDWHPDWNFWTLSGDLAVNPTNSQQLWLTNGLGVWQTENALAKKSNWLVQVDGIEETVPFDAISTPGGASLITAIADFDGFRHTDITKTPDHSHSHGEFSTTTSISYSPSNPNFLVRASSNHHNYLQHSGFSQDNGITWQKFVSIEQGTHPKDLNFGNIAISAQNNQNIVWQGTDWALPYYTKDGGKSWQRINFFKQFGGGAHTHLWNPQQALAADTVKDGTFYLYHHVGGQLLRSQDGGESWIVANQNHLLPSGVWTGANVKTAPGKAGEVWVSLEEQGLYRSTDGGATFIQLKNVDEAQVFGFGKAAPGTTNPTLFVQGKINNRLGIFFSKDFGKTWFLSEDFPQNYLGSYTSLTGDMNHYGRVYLGTVGNGFIYSDLEKLMSNR